MDKGQACDDCGQLFDTTHDVQRHVKNGWCPEHRESKKRPHEEISDSEQEEPVEDNEGYVKLWKVARTHNERKYDQIYNKLIDIGEESVEAKESADDRIQPYTEKGFLGLYTSLIDRYILPLRNSRLHTQIMSQVDKLISKGHSTTSAATKVIRKHRKYFEDLFDLESSEDEEEESGEESDARQEFRAKKVQNLMKKEEIHYFPTQNETKASTSERAILTIKTRLMRYFSYKETATFLPVIQDIADSYNKTHHRTIGMRPVDVKASNQEEVRLATYFTRNPKSKKQGPKLKQFKLK
ncbi:YMD3-like protein, partial [Mya arenaria]